MGPIQLILTALTTGATLAAEAVAGQAIRDAYAAIKKLINERYTTIQSDVEKLEEKPDNALRQQLIQQALEEANADQDMQLLRKAQALLAAAEAQGPALQNVTGINMEKVRAASLNLTDIIAHGTGNVIGVNMNDITVDGAIEISNVRATSVQGNNNKVIYGDEVAGDKVGGDKVAGNKSTGDNISATIGDNNSNITVGKDISQ